jgi:hypothetical protein
MDCLETWDVPIEKRRSDTPEPEAPETQEDDVAKPKLTCQYNCGHKPFSSEKWKLKHEEACAKEKDGSVEESPDLPHTPATETARSAMGSVIDSLRNKRESMIRDNEEIQKIIAEHPDIRKIDAAIKLLESVQDV